MGQSKCGVEFQKLMLQAEDCGAATSPSSVLSGCFASDAGQIANEGYPIKQPLHGDVDHAIPIFLCTFIPQALKAMKNRSGGSQHAAESAIAVAALAVATLLNAPIACLEFLLHMPWSKVFKGYSIQGDVCASEPDIINSMRLQSRSLAQCAEYVNTPLDPVLLDTVMDFVYMQGHKGTDNSCLPIPLVLPPGEQYVKGNGAAAGLHQRLVRANLEGATVVHCAALVASPDIIEFVCSYGGDPLVRNKAGILPLCLVPSITDAKDAGVHQTSGTEGEAKAMNSFIENARLRLAWQTMTSFNTNFLSWIATCLLSLLYLIAFLIHFPLPSAFHTSAMVSRAYTMWDERQQEALRRAHGTLKSLRSAIAKGLKDLRASSNSSRASGAKHFVGHCSETAMSAYESFSLACNILFDMGERCNEDCCKGSLIPEQCYLDRDSDWRKVQVTVVEQATAWCGLAESSLAAVLSCRCSGCAASAWSAESRAFGEVVKLLELSCMGKRDKEVEVSLRRALRKIVCVRAELLMELVISTGDPTMWAVRIAQQCVDAWTWLLRFENCTLGKLSEDKVEKLVEQNIIERLKAWASRAEADFMILSVLLDENNKFDQGCDHERLSSCYRRALVPFVSNSSDLSQGSGTRQMRLARSPLQVEELENLRKAIDNAERDALGTPSLIQASKHAVSLAQGEFDARERLQGLLNQRKLPTDDFIAELSDARQTAACFPSMTHLVEEADAIAARWAERKKIHQRLVAAIEKGRGIFSAELHSNQEDTASQLTKILVDLTEGLESLEAAMAEAKKVNLHVDKAKRLAKALVAEKNAFEVAQRLDNALQQGLSWRTIQSMLRDADEALTRVSHSTVSVRLAAKVLGPLLHRSREKIEMDRALDALNKAIQSCQKVSDVQALDEAIATARRTGLHESATELYQKALGIKSRLHAAAALTTTLDSAIAAKRNAIFSKDVCLLLCEDENRKKVSNLSTDFPDRCDSTFRMAESFQNVLHDEIELARKEIGALKHASSVAESLRKMLTTAPTAHQLLSAIKAAASVGLLVSESRRVYKMMHSLENALHRVNSVASDVVDFSSLSDLHSKIEDAVNLGVNRGIKGSVLSSESSFITSAKETLCRLLMSNLRKGLFDVVQKAVETLLMGTGRDLRALSAELEQALGRLEEARRLKGALPQDLDKVKGNADDGAPGDPEVCRIKVHFVVIKDAVAVWFARMPTCCLQDEIKSCLQLKLKDVREGSGPEAVGKAAQEIIQLERVALKIVQAIKEEELQGIEASSAENRAKTLCQVQEKAKRDAQERQIKDELQGSTASLRRRNEGTMLNKRKAQLQKQAEEVRALLLPAPHRHTMGKLRHSEKPAWQASDEYARTYRASGGINSKYGVHLQKSPTSLPHPTPRSPHAHTYGAQRPSSSPSPSRPLLQPQSLAARDSSSSQFGYSNRSSAPSPNGSIAEWNGQQAQLFPTTLFRTLSPTSIQLGSGLLGSTAFGDVSDIPHGQDVNSGDSSRTSESFSALEAAVLQAWQGPKHPSDKDGHKIHDGFTLISGPGSGSGSGSFSSGSSARRDALALPLQGAGDQGMSVGLVSDVQHEYEYDYSHDYGYDGKFEIDPHQSEREAQLLQALEAARSQGLGSAQGQELEGSRPLCHFYSMGYCRSGDKCPYRHSTGYQGEYQARPGGNSLPPSLRMENQGHLALAVEHEREVPSLAFSGSSLLSSTPTWSSEVMPGPTLLRSKSWDLYGQDFQDWPLGPSSADADASGSVNVDWGQVDGEEDVQQKSTCNGAGNDFGLPNEINFF